MDWSCHRRYQARRSGRQRNCSRSEEAAIKKFSTKVRIYWSDCDPAGIVYYGNFFRFFEVAEEELFLSLGGARIDLYRRLQIGFPRVEVWCRFRKPVPEGELVEITTWVNKRTQTGMVFNLELRRHGDDEVAAEAHYRVVCVKRPEFKPVPIPDEMLHLLRDYIPPLTKHTTEHKT